MVKTQVMAMLKMNDAALKKYLEKECKHKEEILQSIVDMRMEAIAAKDQQMFDQLSWLQNVVKGIEVLCPE